MDQTVLEHLCEAYLFWTLYATDFIALLQVSEEHAEEFGDKLYKWYENRHREQNRLKEENPLLWFEYEKGGVEFAKYLVALIKEREGVK